MKIIITAAGMGSRFLKENIKKPKYLIVANQRTLFEYSLLTLSDFFESEFIFLFRDLKDNYQIKQILNNLTNHKQQKITKYWIANVKNINKGQAETVSYIKDVIDNNESILIFNIDTYIKDAHLYITKNDISNDLDGLIYTTKVIGDHWSFAKTQTNSNVVYEVSEKIRISDNASIGLYYFKSFNQFYDLLKMHKWNIIQKYQELYIMPIYQYLIDLGLNVQIKDIPYENFIPLGTPNEVLNFDNTFIENNLN